VRARNTGRPYDAERWAAGQERRADLVRQSRWLADALERQGIRARETGDEAVDIDHVLGTVEAVERFRPLRFLPVIMQRDSAAMLASLRYFLHNHERGEYARMGVITGGARIPVGGPLRDRHKAMGRAISRWASMARLLHGVEVFFRGMEYTRDDGQGPDAGAQATPTYHHHAHVLYTPTERMPEGEWVRFLAWSEGFLRTRMEGTAYAFTDCGRVREPDEACKYPFKPAELARAPDREVAWLQAQVHGLNMKQPMGSLRTFNRSMEDNTRLTGEEQADPETGELLPVSVRAPLKVVALYPDDDGSKAVLAIVHKRRRPVRGDRDEVRDERPDRPQGPVLRENLILFTSNPTSSACPWATVKTRVVGYTENPATEEGFLALAELASITAGVRRAWDANGGPPPPPRPPDDGAPGRRDGEGGRRGFPGLAGRPGRGKGPAPPCGAPGGPGGPSAGCHGRGRPPGAAGGGLWGPHL